MKTLGERIRELRESRDISLRELARKLELTAPFLSDVELGRRYPSAKVLMQIAQKLHVTPSELQSHDSRPPLEDMKRRAEQEPAFGFALRQVMESEIPTDRLLELVKKAKAKKRK